MELYLALGIMSAILIAFSILALTWGRKIKIAKDCRILKESYSWCTATIYIDKNIPHKNGFCLSGPDKVFVEEKKLSFACAASMKAVNFYVNKHKLFGSKGNLKDAIFVFLTDKVYDKMTEDHIIKSNGYSKLAKANMFGKGKYFCYIREKFMPQVTETGQLAVHEFLHCMLLKTTGDGDGEHKSNLIVLEKGKTIETLCNDAVKIILANKFRK